MLSHSQKMLYNDQNKKKKMLYNDQNKKKIDIVVDVFYIEKMNIKYILDKNIL